MITNIVTYYKYYYKSEKKDPLVHVLLKGMQCIWREHNGNKAPKLLFCYPGYGFYLLKGLVSIYLYRGWKCLNCILLTNIFLAVIFYCCCLFCSQVMAK